MDSESINEASINEVSINVAVVRGVCSSPPEVRVLPSEQRLAQLQLTTRVDGRAMSVPVSVIDPPAWLDEIDSGDELVVLGAVRRRFFRAGGQHGLSRRDRGRHRVPGARPAALASLAEARRRAPRGARCMTRVRPWRGRVWAASRFQAAETLVRPVATVQ